MLLHQLLDQGLGFDPLYLPDYNSDHLPMTLVAMDYLGANLATLQKFQREYSQRLRPIEPSPKYASLAEGRGQKDAFASNRDFLLAEIEAGQWQQVVRDHLPGLLPSLAAGAFHPLIRLGAAISVGYAPEVASALAYWMTSRFQPELATPLQNQDLSEVLRADRPVGIQQASFGAGLREVLEQGYPAPVETSLRDCAQTGLDVYLGTRNFFALHLVTATQAARMCRPFVEESELLKALTAGIRAAYLVVGAPDFSTPMPVPSSIDPEHGLKYVYACATEYEAWGDPRYLEEIKEFQAAGLVPDWVRISV